MTARQAADGQQRGVFEVDQGRALAELELARADGGYHGFCAEGGTCDQSGHVCSTKLRERAVVPDLPPLPWVPLG